jgi:hypothetical protein
MFWVPLSKVMWLFSKEEVEMAKKKNEKMPIIPGYKGNANQNHVKIIPHAY